MSDLEPQAAITEALTIFRAARRPRCWRCRQVMDRDISGPYWHCTIAGCRGSVLSVDSSLLWEPQS